MTTEKRLIDANGSYTLNECNETGHSLCFSVGFIDVYDYKGKHICQFWAGDAPTVDAVEVKHGRWEDEYGGKYANPRFRCSVCKKRALYKFERGVLGNWEEVQALTPFCPYCMAVLDGGTDNDI